MSAPLFRAPGAAPFNRNDERYTTTARGITIGAAYTPPPARDLGAHAEAIQAALLARRRSAADRATARGHRAAAWFSAIGAPALLWALHKGWL